jgi:hypothetical protein
MTNSIPQSVWVTAYASVMGNGHIVQNLPCQDSHFHQHIVNSVWSIAIVSDGAGSASHSDKGSDFVVRNTAQCFEKIISEKGWNSPETLPTAEEWRTEAQVALQIVWQRLKTFAESEKLTLKDLSCTIIVAIYSPFGVLMAHIGDGRGAYYDGQSWKALFVPFRGEEANQTVFITSDIWNQEGVAKYLDTNVLVADIQALALCSDGCEKGSFRVAVYNPDLQKYEDLNEPFDRFFNPNMEGLLQLHKEQKTQEEINALWADFLKAGHQQFKHEIDDKTLIMAVRVPVEDNVVAAE